MEIFINTNTNVYPYYIGNLKNDYPEYNVYQPLPEGIFPVVWVNEPEVDITKQYVTEAMPTEKDGVWTIQWDIHDYAPGEYLNKLVTDLAGRPL